MRRKILLAVTGASGAPIAARLIETLLEREELELSFVFSDHARETFKFETGIDLGSNDEELRSALAQNFKLHPWCEVLDVNDMSQRASSGSHLNGGMIIAPCSMSTLAAIAHGITLNLIHRAASVMLKEKRPLLLVPRESPLSPIHLQNMAELSRIGVHIVPPTIAFYSRPRKVEDLVDFVCARILDLVGIPHELSKRWDGKLQFHEQNPRIRRDLE